MELDKSPAPGIGGITMNEGRSGMSDKSIIIKARQKGKTETQMAMKKRELPESDCSECDHLREALVKITQMNCTKKTDIVEMIREIREIAREAVPDYSDRARTIKKNDKEIRSYEF